ncbi:hypothetical protein ACQWHJ_25980, partial [Salmonella enterica subsp. enterica serovar Infantis]
VVWRAPGDCSRKFITQNTEKKRARQIQSQQELSILLCIKRNNTKEKKKKQHSQTYPPNT